MHVQSYQVAVVVQEADSVGDVVQSHSKVVGPVWIVGVHEVVVQVW